MFLVDMTKIESDNNSLFSNKVLILIKENDWQIYEMDENN
ncbi:hypothetical protein MBCUT_16500 [Methanobrevibacter cuticularis]|uniref:Uncharacterized protein n=1 Tax=Methanobrevibacter cuticularis TaxID=47311 RepID=A0A166D4D2_9EURY|nr:hypothetical protein MBCUT_16500 [Methanobrevibacter cuticularis]